MKTKMVKFLLSFFSSKNVTKGLKCYFVNLVTFNIIYILFTSDIQYQSNLLEY